MTGQHSRNRRRTLRRWVGSALATVALGACPQFYVYDLKGDAIAVETVETTLPIAAATPVIRAESVVSGSLLTLAEGVGVNSVNSDALLWLESATEKADIYYLYVIGGGSPVNPNPYGDVGAARFDASKPVAVSGHGTIITIRAITLRSQYYPSAYVERELRINYDRVSTPMVSSQGSATNLSIVINTSPADATIWYQLTVDSTTPAGAVVPGTDSQYTGPIQLDGLRRYNIKAIATKNQMLDSPETAWAEFVETAAPTGFSAGGATASSIDLSWNLLAGADRYELWRDDGAGGPLTKITDLAGNVASHTDAGLIGTTTYVYQLVAANDAQTLTSVPTATVAVQTLAVSPPANPIVSSIASSYARLDWDAAAGAASYDVYRDDGAGGAIVLLTNVATNTYLDTNLAPAATYRYQVRANSPGGNSGLSTVAGATTTSSESEKFPDPLGGWKTRTMGLYSNLVNYYVATGSSSEDNRGNNPDGLWIHDGDLGDSNSYIRFTQPYASTVKTFSIDVGTGMSPTIVIFDQNLNVLLSEVVSTGNVSLYFTYSVSSTNGVGGFDITGSNVEGNVSIDNILVTR